MSNYTQAKRELLEIAKDAKKDKTDKPRACQIINDAAYEMERAYSLTERQVLLLQNYAAKLQPK